MTELNNFDAAEYVKDDDSQRELLADALASREAGYIAIALGVIARAKGMTQVKRETGMKRQALYRALSTSGNPTRATTMKVLNSLGLKLAVA